MIDLDGTLIDTAPDLIEAANRMLSDLRLPPRPADEITSFIGQGLRNLVARCVGPQVTADAAAFAQAFAIYERHYAAVSGQLSAVYPGAREGLDSFRAQGLRLACVTNKLAEFTLPLLARFGFKDDFDLVVSGDTTISKKPEPGPLLYACAEFGLPPTSVLMLGDSPNDTEAARRAGCPVACLPYGYREGLEVRELDCDVIVSTLAEAARLVQAGNAGQEAGQK